MGPASLPAPSCPASVPWYSQEKQLSTCDPREVHGPSQQSKPPHSSPTQSFYLGSDPAGQASALAWHLLQRHCDAGQPAAPGTTGECQPGTPMWTMLSDTGGSRGCTLGVEGGHMRAARPIPMALRLARWSVHLVCREAMTIIIPSPISADEEESAQAVSKAEVTLRPLNPFSLNPGWEGWCCLGLNVL